MAKDTNKLATNIDEQMALLKSRGMIFENEAKARENLLDIGYYRLGFYWFPFEALYPREDRRDHKFRAETLFENVIQLYYFDFDVRNVFLRYISRIEINFRTKLIYEASNFWHDNPFWYIDGKCIKRNFLDNEDYVRAIHFLDNEPVVARDQKKYNRDHAPAWKAIEFMPLGIVSQLFANLKDEGIARSRISKYFGINSPNQLYEYIEAIRRLRNSCAHGKVIFDYKLPGALPNAQPIRLNPSQITNLSGTYEVLKYLLGCVSKNRVVDLQSDLAKAFGRVDKEEVMSIITQNTGIDAKNL